MWETAGGRKKTERPEEGGGLEGGEKQGKKEQAKKRLRTCPLWGGGALVI